MMGTREESLVGNAIDFNNIIFLKIYQNFEHGQILFYKIQMLITLFRFSQEDVLAPPPENDDVVNDFDIEEEVTEAENRPVTPSYSFIHLFYFQKFGSVFVK